MTDFAAYKATDAQDDSNETDSDEPSTTYVEFNSRDHPTAYELARSGGDLRDALGSDIHDFFAVATPALTAYVANNEAPMLELLGFSEERAAELSEELADDDDSDE
jgi:hypothetical protein